MTERRKLPPERAKSVQCGEGQGVSGLWVCSEAAHKVKGRREQSMKTAKGFRCAKCGAHYPAGRSEFDCDRCRPCSSGRGLPHGSEIRAAGGAGAPPSLAGSATSEGPHFL